MEDATPYPELSMIRIAEIALRCLKGDISDAIAMTDIIGILDLDGVPFPRNEDEARRIRDGYSLRD